MWPLLFVLEKISVLFFFVFPQHWVLWSHVSVLNSIFYSQIYRIKGPFGLKSQSCGLILLGHSVFSLDPHVQTVSCNL